VTSFASGRRAAVGGTRLRTGARRQRLRASRHARGLAEVVARRSPDGAMHATTLQLGIYRDGDNDLDRAEAPALDAAFELGMRDPRIAFTVEDFTARPTFATRLRVRRTEQYRIEGGRAAGRVRVTPPRDPASRAELARFVARTLDPTVHLPARAAERDPWAPQVCENDPAFYRRSGGDRVERVLAAAERNSAAEQEGYARHRVSGVRRTGA
jgi:hypothetical protein